MLPLVSANDETLLDGITMTLVPVTGQPFFMEWDMKEEGEALEYANNQLKHWCMDCVHLEYGDGSKVVTLEKTI